jgi:N12 class adenine-specific DNA methylase
LGLCDTHARPIRNDTAIARNTKGNPRNRIRQRRTQPRCPEIARQGSYKGNACGVIKRKENLEVKLKTLQHDIENRKDDIVDFKMMGIDHLFVDESHNSKT